MRILVLGGTGRTGKLIIDYALSIGYQVNCLVRYPEKITLKNNLQIYQGSTLDGQDIEKASEGCDAILSALNISRTSDFPFAPLRTPKYFLSKTIQNVLKVAAKNDIKRLIVCSAWGVSESRKDIPFWFRWTIDYSNIKHAYLDHEKQENLIEKSTSNWTIIRPVGLTNGSKSQKTRESIDNKPKPSLLINRRSVAKYMVDSVKNNILIHKKITISREN